MEDKPNRKCVVIEYLEGSLSDGGAETLVKDYVLFLDKALFKPIILVDWVFKGSANYQRLKDSGVEITSFYPRYSFFWRAVNKFFRNRYIDHKLKKIIEEKTPDVIHAHLACLNHLEAVKNSLDGIKLFYTCHSEPWFYFDKMKNEEKAAKVLIRDCGLRLIALRYDMKGELDSRFHTDNTVVVKNGIDLTLFHSSSDKGLRKRKELSIDSSSFVVGHVGRFSEEKNHVFLLDVFKEVLKVNEDSHLVLVGDGELEGQIREKIKHLGIGPKVTILSNRTDIPDLLNMMDVFVFPSLYEGLGMALIEAQAVGVRCVVSKNVNPEAFVSDLVVVESLGDSAKKWARDALDGSSFGPYENRVCEYDIQHEIKKLEQLYGGK